MKDLFFKDLSYEALLNIVERKRRTHILFIPKLGVVRPKIYPCNETKGRGTPIARRILILRSSLLLSGRTI